MEGLSTLCGKVFVIVEGNGKQQTGMNLTKKIGVALGVLVIVAIWVTILLWDSRSPSPQEVATATEQPSATVVTPAVTDGVVSNDDGSVTIRGNASFTMAPVSSSRPPAMVPESEAKKLSSPPQN